MNKPHSSAIVSKGLKLFCTQVLLIANDATGILINEIRNTFMGRSLVLAALHDDQTLLWVYLHGLLILRTSIVPLVQTL